MRSSESGERIFRGCRLVLPDRVIYGTLTTRNGVIASLEEEKEGSDADDAPYLLPGLVELHTDHLEKCIAPRPGISWPLPSAILRYDRELFAAGITTACAAVAVRDIPGRPSPPDRVAAVVEALKTEREAGTLRADHRLHLRCEVTTPSAPDVLHTYLGDPMLSVVSLMDHAPGQRQFVSRERFRAYYGDRYGLRGEELDTYEQELLAEGPEGRAARRRRLADAARAHGIAVASHDDATPEHALEAAREGVTLSEFPTTLAAAEAAKSVGLPILMGAPNIVLNRSHSGNASAREAAAHGFLDLLSSDYAPHSLLEAAFLLHFEEGVPLPAAVAMVTSTPARLIGLTDRGTLVPGLRADLVLVHTSPGRPCAIEAVYAAGENGTRNLILS
jgi:alpha-D-ribose 1-methylphosphonate 5-triphosphate diphosphatase